MSVTVAARWHELDYVARDPSDPRAARSGDGQDRDPSRWARLADIGSDGHPQAQPIPDVARLGARHVPCHPLQVASIVMAYILMAYIVMALPAMLLVSPAVGYFRS